MMPLTSNQTEDAFWHFRRGEGGPRPCLVAKEFTVIKFEDSGLARRKSLPCACRS